jgi:hypothetical protein
MLNSRTLRPAKKQFLPRKQLFFCFTERRQGEKDCRNLIYSEADIINMAGIFCLADAKIEVKTQRE